MPVIVCSECFARSDDAEGHAPTCRSTGGWAGREDVPRPGHDLDQLLRAATRASEILEQYGQLGGEGEQSLLHQGIGLLRLLRDYKGSP